jgi:streptomycin 6-kinase
MKEEIAFGALERVYKEVQQGRVTVPDAIRDLADKFDAVARDPQKSKAFKYDAARAARSLYRRAQESEELEATENADSLNSFFDDTTATMRRPSDENMNY